MFGVWKKNGGWEKNTHVKIHICVLFRSNVSFIECRFDYCDDVNVHMCVLYVELRILESY